MLVNIKPIESFLSYNHEWNVFFFYVQYNKYNIIRLVAQLSKLNK